MGKEKVFYADVPAGNTITIQRTTTSFDSRHETRWGGGSCPGDTRVDCTNDPDTEQHTWTNDQGSTQRVYFIVKGYDSSRSGTFTLAWNQGVCCGADTYYAAATSSCTSCPVGKSSGAGLAAVSYTHLTLPTILLV